MKPQSGKHRIKFKINKINNTGSRANIVGIVSEKCKQIKNRNIDNFRWYWDDQLFDYIGWSAYDKKK